MWYVSLCGNLFIAAYVDAQNDVEEENAEAQQAGPLEDSDAVVRFSDREDQSGSQFSTPQKRQNLR